MYGGSGKLGRGAGGAPAGKRNIHAPPIGRPSPAAPTGRLSLGGGPRGRGGAPSAAASAPSTYSLQVDESFSLVRENPLNFAMAIKLVPDLVEEIKRVESEGGTARIKFDANPNNSNGNVINVGDKNFKFTWSRENPDLCDIYEERQSGEHGNGLLVESGGTWRKLNVQRVLDESTKNHVKMRSEEAERKHKSRKAIVLDHQNSSMKNQMKAFAASESNLWRNFKQKKEPPFKKPKSEPPPAVGPPKSVFKAGLSTTNPSKSKLFSGSPMSSQSNQNVAPASPVGSGNLVKGHASVTDAAPTQNINKSAGSDKDMHSKQPSISLDKSKHNRNTEAKPGDLRNLMISLLKEHQSKGMSLKALEKAIGDAMPNSARQIEPILKQIATFQAPGRYFLKPGMEIESFKKPTSGSGSSPELNHHQSPGPQKFDQLPQDTSFSMRTAPNEEEQAQLNSSPVHALDTVEKIDILHNSPDHLGDRKVSDHSEGLACSSSDSASDSDSDSDSSDSGSDSGSHSRSKSRSPAGSQSGSSSDSESDASSSSKQISDEDVDIMTSDDDKASKPKPGDPEPVSSKSPVQWRHPDDESVDIGNYEKQDEHVSDVVEIEKDSPEDDRQGDKTVANYSFANKEAEPVEDIKSSANHHEHQQRQVYDRESYGGPERGVNDSSEHRQFSSHEKSSIGKSKRRSDDMHFDEMPSDSKRLKSKTMSQPVSGTLNLLFGESPYNSSPDRPLQGPGKGPIDQIASKNTRDGSNDTSTQTGYNQGIPTKSVPDAPQTGQRSSEASGQVEAPPSGEKRSGKHDSMGRGVKYSERSLQTSEGLRIQKGFNSETQNEDGLSTERRPAKWSAEDVREKHGRMSESHYRKNEVLGKVKEAVPHSNSYTGYPSENNNTSTADRSPVMNGRGSVLRREHSDLELGELRESFHGENSGPKRQLERKDYPKQVDNRQPDSEYWNSDSGRGKPSYKTNMDSRKLSPPNSEANVSGIPERPSKRKVPEHYGEDLTKPHNRGTRPLPQQQQPWVDHTEVASQQNRVPDMSSKSRYVEAGPGQGPILDAHGDSSRKGPVYSTDRHHDPIREVVPHSAKENKKQKPNKVADANGRRKDASLTESNDGGQKRRESSSDENSCSYTKYEKEEPELKGPIKDISQYKEYVKEYQEKYESYCSLNKVLESYRDEFSKLGKDLEAYRDRDAKRYNEILGQMRASYRRCGERHKRLKKIFVVLYEELKHLKQMIADYAATYRKE